jgi:hypothetical protein
MGLGGDAVGVVGEVACGCGWVVAGWSVSCCYSNGANLYYHIPHLFTHNPRLRARAIFPLAQETFSEKRIQRFLDPSCFDVDTGADADVVLPFQRAEPKLQYEERAVGWIIFERWGYKEGWSLSPVGGEFDEGLRGEDEWGRGDGGEVAANSGEELWPEMSVLESSCIYQGL